jgi:hypothetical protein
MSIWSSRVSEHPAVGELKEVAELLDELSAEADDEAAEHLDRGRRLVSLLRTRLTDGDPLLLTQSWLHEAQQHVAALRRSVEQWRDRGGDLNLTAETDALASKLNEVDRGAASAEAAALSEEVSSFRRSLGQQAGHTRRELEEVTKEKDELASALEASKAQVAELVQTVESQKARLDEAISRNEEQFSRAQEQRSTRFSDVLEQERAEAEKLREQLRADDERALSDLRAEVEETAKATKSQVEELIAEVQEQKAAAERIVQATAQTGMIGGFQKDADAERTSAMVWGIVAVLAGVAVAGVGVLTLLGATDAETLINVQEATSKLLIGGALGAVATFAGKRCVDHRREERFVRRRELDLAAIGPYLEALDDPDARKQLLVQMAGQAFFRDQSSDPDEEPKLALSMVKDLVKAAGRS